MTLSRDTAERLGRERLRFFAAACLAALALAASAGAARAQPAAGAAGEETIPLEIQSDFSDYDHNLGIAKAWGDVEVTYGEVTILAGQVEYHHFSGKIFARENVRVFRGTEVFDAEEVIYDTTTDEMTTSQIRSALDPVFFSSDDVIRPENEDDPIVLNNATFTTHDSANPNYRFVVKRLDVYPNDRLVMRGARLYAGNLPVFWFPYYVQPLDADLGYYVTPGWNSAWGGFALNRYGFMLGDKILATTHLDLRSRRGLGGGVEFQSRELKDNDNIGRLKLYYAEDNDPQLRFNGRRRSDLTTSSRHRINFQHRVYFPGVADETLYLDFDINRLSDPFVYEDFFPSEFRIDPRPDNVVNLVKLLDNAEISLTGRFHINDFFRTDTRSPELAIDILRTPLGDTGFFYQGLTTYGIIDEKLDPDSILAGIIEPSGFNRFQTYHEFLFPTQLAGFLNVVPRAGAGYANYSNFDMPGIGTFDATTFHGGVDLSFKMSKRSPHVYNRALGIDGLLHVVRPYLNYSYLNTNEIDGRFLPIDRFTPTTRLRPIDMPLFTAMDDLRNWQIARAGLSNRWMTRRDGRTFEWLSVNNYFDIYLQDPEFDRDFSNFFTEVDWSPLPWLTASTTAQFPLFENVLEFSEVTTALTFMPTDWFRFSVGHYFLNDHPLLDDTNLYTFDTYTRLSDNWGFGTSHRFETEDSILEYQQYSIHRDLSSWTAAFGGIIRDNRRGEKDYGLVLSLTLKAFPRVKLPVDFQPGDLAAE